MSNDEVVEEVEEVKDVEDGIWYDNKCIPLVYEELVDLLAHYRNSGDETHTVLTRQKCRDAFGPVIPMTNY